MPRPLRSGIYAPTQIFWLPSAEAQVTSTTLDTTTIARHAVRLAKAGVAGLVTNGSNGEASLLSVAERATATRTTREALDVAGFGDVPVISGASDASVSGTLALCSDAAAAGADAVLLLAPAFVGGGMGAVGMERYFRLVADESPLPVIIYNYPAAAAGVDLDSDALIRLAKHPNIAGAKFTCGNVGKMARVVEELGTRVVSEGLLGAGNTPREAGQQVSTPYFAFIGVADAILPSVGTVGGTGGIVGAANVFPRACVEVYKLAVEGRWLEASQAQLALAKADWSLTKRGVPGFKAVLEQFCGYGGSPRLPMAPLSTDAAKELCDEIRQFMEYEQQLPDLR